MDKKDLRNADIELVYIYIEKITDEFEQEVYSNISVNLSGNIMAAYDYEKGLLRIEKKETVPDNFWSTRERENTNILNNILILGENGAGKTTLLEMIYAGNLENIENRLGNYMFLYSIKGTDRYYIKSFGLKWLDDLKRDAVHTSIKSEEEKTKVRECGGVLSYLCQVKRENIPTTTGYCGLATIDSSGKIIIDSNAAELNTQSQVRERWSRSPMNGIFLSTALNPDEEPVRFLARKQIHPKAVVTKSEMTEFICNDMRKEKRIIKSKPYLFLSNITVGNLTKEREVFKTELEEIYKDITVGAEMKTARDKKYQFFTVLWIAFLLRLQVNQLLTEKLKDCLVVAPTYKEIYDHTVNLFTRLFQYESAQLFERYGKLLQAVDRLDEKLFLGVRFERKSNAYSWNVSIEKIAQNNEWYAQLMEFLRLKDDFEYNLQKKIQNERTWDRIPGFMMNHRISNMSSGETILIAHVFAKIAKNMKMIMKQELGTYSKSVLLIMDEPDCTFHIRWTQQFTEYLIEFLNTHYPNFSFQIIMTSHMPFLATDYPRGNIICIPREEWIESREDTNLTWVDGSRLLDNKDMYQSLKAFTPDYGFMSNYYDLVKDNFFVDVPIGMFAQNKFDHLKERVDAIRENTSPRELEHIRMEIELIDEPVLKKYIYDAFQEKKIDRMSRAEMEETAALLRKQLEEIDLRLNNMRE